jgi:glycosyltransferase involved in cell wall biosynthesis
MSGSNLGIGRPATEVERLGGEEGKWLLKPKVLQFIGNLYPGGSENQAVQLVRLLLESSRYEVHIASMDARGELRYDLEKLGFHEIPEFRLTSFFDLNAIRQLFRFARLLREREIDIIQTHDFYTNVFGMAAALLARVPVRIAARRETGGWRTAAQLFIEHKAYGLAHAVVANAEAVRDQLLKEGLRTDKIVTIYNGLDLERLKPRLTGDDAFDLIKLPRGGAFQYVTIVANMLHPVKDHPTFLRAAKRVREAVPAARFVIAGLGHLTDDMRALAGNLGIADDVFFIGRCEQIAELLACSDVCVLSSTAEGFSNSIIEYMGAARPVVVTDVGGAREAVIEGETGYLVKAGDDAAMADRITGLLLDPQRAREMGARGRRVVEEKFSLGAQLGRTSQLFDRLLSPGALPQKKGRDGEEPTRVLIVAPSLDILGGQAVQARRLLEGFSNEPSLDVSFLPVNPRLPWPLRKLQSIKYLRTIVTSIFYWGILLWRVRAYDVIHVFSASYWSFILAPTPAILVARLYGKKVLLNYRSGEAEDHLKNWRLTALPIMRLVDKIVVPSGYLVEVFRRFGLWAESVPNTIDLNRFAYRERMPLRPILLSNRNFEAHYNVECVLRAFALIQKEMPEARLIVAGDGSRRSFLHALTAELELQEVEFTGQVANEKMQELYQRADIFINASDIDNMPVSHIEAFACGLPVVTTDAGGIPYIVNHGRNGLMVSRDDHKGLAAGVLQLLRDRELAARLISTAQRDCQQYTWMAVREGWLKVYSELTHLNGKSTEVKTEGVS